MVYTTLSQKKESRSTLLDAMEESDRELGFVASKEESLLVTGLVTSELLECSFSE